MNFRIRLYICSFVLSAQPHFAAASVFSKCLKVVASTIDEINYNKKRVELLNQKGEVLFPSQNVYDLKNLKSTIYLDEAFPKEMRNFLNIYKNSCEKILKMSPRISLEDCIFIQLYTGSFYKRVNKTLRAGSTADRDLLENSIAALASARNAFPKHNGLSRRFAKFSSIQEIKQYFQEFKNHTLDTFWSTTLHDSPHKVAISFDDNTQFNIRGKSGANISKFSIYQSEEEILFAPGTKFLVERVQELDKQVNGIQFIVDLKEI